MIKEDILQEIVRIEEQSSDLTDRAQQLLTTLAVYGDYDHSSRVYALTL